MTKDKSTPESETLGAKVRRRRLELGMTQAALAAAVGWNSPEMVSQIESGRRFPHLSRLPKLAEALIVSNDELVLAVVAERYPMLLGSISVAVGT